MPSKSDLEKQEEIKKLIPEVRERTGHAGNVTIMFMDEARVVEESVLGTLGDSPLRSLPDSTGITYANAALLNRLLTPS